MGSRPLILNAGQRQQLQSGDQATPAVFPSWSGTPDFTNTLLPSLTDLMKYAAPRSSINYYFFTGASGPDNKWYGGVVAPNGNIYGIPDQAGAILQIVPTVSASGVASATINIKTLTSVNGCGAGWRGGVLGNDGKIYCCPYTATTILKLTPGASGSTPVCAGVGSVSGTSPYYNGAAVAPNGDIYFAPFNATSVLKLAYPYTTLTTIAITGYTNPGSGWYGAVLAPDGCIYCMPYNALYVLKINPSAGTATVLTDSVGGNGAYAGGVLGPDGNIYGVPFGYYTGQILKLNVATQRAGYVGAALPAINGKCSGGCLGANGLIYMVPNSASVLYIYNTATGAWNSVTLPSNDFAGAVLAPNGAIYCIPFISTQQVMQLGDGCDSVPLNLCLSPYYNNY